MDNEKKKYKLTIDHTDERLMSLDIPGPESLVERFINPEDTGVLVSADKTERVTLGLQLCLTLPLGETFLGHQTHPCSTLYISLREDEETILKRAFCIYPNYEERLAEQECRFYHGSLKQRGPGSIKIRPSRFLEVLDEILDDLPDVRLVCIDELRNIRPGATPYWDLIYSLQKLCHRRNVAILLLHQAYQGTETTDVRYSMDADLASGADDIYAIRKNETGQTILDIVGRNIGPDHSVVLDLQEVLD